MVEQESVGVPGFEWSAEDKAQAAAEGWAMQVGSSGTRMVIVPLADNRFASVLAAGAFVERMADRGSPLHQRACEQDPSIKIILAAKMDAQGLAEIESARVLADAQPVRPSAPALEQQLKRLIADGLTFADCVKAFAAQQGDYEKAAIYAASAAYGRDGELEFDDSAMCSVGDEDAGCYVMCWRWIGKDEIDDARAELGMAERAHAGGPRP